MLEERVPSPVSLLTRTLILLDQRPTLVTLFNLNSCLGTNTATLEGRGIGLQNLNVGGPKHSVHGNPLDALWSSVGAR